MSSFQDAILKLSQFWADQGCVLWHPYNIQVGAGTMNPATFLRVLGPEPWNVAYIEPSSRPDDSRYGENPNRIQQHYQFQVILKPAPDNPQELYLESLKVLGIDPTQHDIRFVEDNWEAPALGAWGLGWEVWLDGLEITQFTYFQQAGGRTLDPVSVELTYGLERILMALQGARHFKDICWREGLTYGDLHFIPEVEHSRYNRDDADIERLKQLYELYECEAQLGLERGLVVPAYDYVLKCSHTFNVLDARGAIGVTERARYFDRMCGLARAVATAYVKQREELGFPLVKRPPVFAPSSLGISAKGTGPLDIRDAVLEIGMEALPAADVGTALQQLKELVQPLLHEAGLRAEGVHTVGTPRRLAVYVTGLAPHQHDDERLVKGPPARIAFDEQGRATRAAEGFAHRQHVPVEQLQVREFEGKPYLVAVVVQSGQPTTEVLAELWPKLIARLKFNRTMRWNETNVAFSRPIRWLVALHGDTVVPFEYASVTSGRRSRGLQPLGSPELPIEKAEEYFKVIQAAGIVVDPDERRRRIREQLDALATDIGGRVPDDPGLLDEVTQLVEQPAALRGTFEAAYLALPREVLITVMKQHQRYFPLEMADEEGALLPYFIAVVNGGMLERSAVQAGNEAVLRARFADADFFFGHDRRQRLEDFLPGLATLTFQERLGSMAEKVRRLERLVPHLATRLSLTPEEAEIAWRAARLCKADLATEMVIEFTALQGVMGQEYARHSGEDPRVAQAIFEHYLPRFAGDVLPESRPGIVVGLADRLDSLVGLFAVGLQPTGSADPWGLRRAALGLVQVLIEQRMPLALREVISDVTALLPIPVGGSLVEEMLDFVRRRLQGWLLDRGYRYDLVEAVLAERGDDPHGAFETVQALARWAETEDFTPLLLSYSRSARIVREVRERFALDPAHLQEPASRGLYEAYMACRARLHSATALDSLFQAMLPLVQPINRFFDEILVMTEDQALRAARLGLLQHITALPRGMVDLSKVKGF